MRLAPLVPVLLALLVLPLLACGGETKEAVSQYLDHIRASRFSQAYGMVSEDKRKQLSEEEWRTAMSTEVLADVQDFSVDRYRSVDGKHCLLTNLDFRTRKDRGPYGFYIFYLIEESGRQRIEDVLTYDRIDGMVAHFEKSREPFGCHSPGTN